MSIQDDVIRLYKAGAKRIVLSELQARPQIQEARGATDFVESASSSDSQLTPPLTESSRTTQNVMVDVPENATQVEIEVITSLVMVDARGVQYTFNFTPPA